MSTDLKKLFEQCLQEIGGRGNADVQYVLESKKKFVTRESFFDSATWAILVSGVSRKSAETFSRRVGECGFNFDYEQTLEWSQFRWDKMFESLYPSGVSGRGGKKWAAIRSIAKMLHAFPNEVAFRHDFFGAKEKGCELDEDDVKRIISKRLSFVRYANSEYIVRNMGGETIKCDRWLATFLNYFKMSELDLKQELRSLKISLSLFDVVIWAYCECNVGSTNRFKEHFDRLHCSRSLGLPNG